MTPFASMTDIEISILTLMAKGLFVLISVLCITSVLNDAMAAKGWRSVRAVAIWLVWGLMTFSGAFIVMVLANAHSHIHAATLAIRIIAVGYVLAGMGLVVYLVKQLRP